MFNPLTTKDFLPEPDASRDSRGDRRCKLADQRRAPPRSNEAAVPAPIPAFGAGQGADGARPTQRNASAGNLSPAGTNPNPTERDGLLSAPVGMGTEAERDPVVPVSVPTLPFPPPSPDLVDMLRQMEAFRLELDQVVGLSGVLTVWQGCRRPTADEQARMDEADRLALRATVGRALLDATLYGRGAFRFSV